MIIAQEPLAPDAIRAAVDRVFASPAYAWEQPPGFLEWVRGIIREVQGAMDGLLVSHPVAYWTIIVAAIVVLIAILVHFTVLVVMAVRGPGPAAAGTPVPALDTEVRDHRWYLRESHRLRDAGRYAEAVALRFRALLLELDRRKALAFHPAKTPVEYAGELDAPEAQRGQFRSLVEELYRVLYAGAECTMESWAAFDRAASGLGGIRATH